MRRAVLLIGTLLLLSGCSFALPSFAIPNGPTAAPSASTAHIGAPTKTSGCQVNGALPDSACTPGAIIASATKDQICVPGYSRSVRNVPQAEKDQVYVAYGIASHSAGEYEVDHLISLELGGSNDIANLWPEAAQPTPGFHEKDKVENYLHSQVCNGAISLEQAQQEIATNWLPVYDQMTGSSSAQSNQPFSTNPSPSGPTNRATPVPPSSSQEVHTKNDDGGGATAQCKDGVLWFAGTHHSGDCRGHSGVAQFYR